MCVCGGGGVVQCRAVPCSAVPCRAVLCNRTVLDTGGIWLKTMVDATMCARHSVHVGLHRLMATRSIQ
jgi:hypothetical protein